MFVTRIQLDLHERRRRLVVQQLKATARHISEFELMAQAFLRAVYAQQRIHARPNMFMQMIGFQIRFARGFERKRVINQFPRRFKLFFINAAIQTLGPACRPTIGGKMMLPAPTNRAKVINPSARMSWPFNTFITEIPHY